MKQCSKCGKQYEDWNIFCRDCGVLLNAMGDAPAQAETPPPIDENTPVHVPVLTLDPPVALPDPPPAPPAEAPGVPEAPPAEAPKSPETPPPPVEVPEKPAQHYDPVPDMFKEPPPAEQPPEREPKRKPSDERLGFGRGLACALIGVLLFFLLAAPYAVFVGRSAASAEGLSAIFSEVRLSEIPANELFPAAEANRSVSGWLSDELYAMLGESFDYNDAEVGKFLDRSSLRADAAIQLDAVLDSYRAGSGDSELSWLEYSRMLQNNSGLFADVFDNELTAASANALAKDMTEKGLPTLPAQDALHETNPAVGPLLRWGLSWLAFGVLLALALLVWIWLLKVGRGALRGFTGLGVVLTVLGGLTTLATLFSKLLPRLWRSLLGGNYLISRLAAGALERTLLIDLGLLAVGVLLLLICGLVRGVKRRKAARHSEHLIDET